MTPANGPILLTIATRKGLWFYRANAARSNWQLEGPHFLGHEIHHAVLDPRDKRTLLVAAKTGHLGPTVFRSQDFGATWKEAAQPPAFRKAAEGERALAVNHVFWLSPGHATEPGTWFAGTSPEGLFRTRDGGVSWEPMPGYNDHPVYSKGVAGVGGTPDGPVLHSILVDPRDPNHMYLSVSGELGGTFESLDAGATWRPVNKGVRVDFQPDPYPEVGQDPHCVRLHPLRPDVLYQQNHVGIYRLYRPDEKWERIGDNMPRDVGDIGFPMVLHPRDPATCWVFPMDGSDVWPRVSPGGKPAVYKTSDSGKSWTRCDTGLPREQAWMTVRRQAMTGDAHDPVGLYFATTHGELWASFDEAASWQCLRRKLPQIHAVEAFEL
ncbi:MAG: glycosyl hydrolase [Deltaproteobacteria bacterium]|nr:glycosyl hydrolase [Deltaproteobacteria bacterium]